MDSTIFFRLLTYAIRDFFKVSILVVIFFFFLLKIIENPIVKMIFKVILAVILLYFLLFYINDYF
ncbi:hypothetical protein COE53_04360 [Bacillus sp. AFS029533]|nr:hypothetical protein COE53_04360 [Bacillus sp. AFS029533]